MPTIEVEQISKRIEVAVGVIRRGNDEVLVGQRLVQDRYFERWEFPGGKLESCETPEHALARELSEELGIQITGSRPLIQLDHDYPDRKVRLYVMEVNSYLGEPHGREGQAIEWISLANTQAKDFLEATQPIFSALTLPQRIMITDTKRFGMNHICEAVAAEVEHGISAMIQVREPDLNLTERNEFTTRLVSCTRGSSVQVTRNDNLGFEMVEGIAGIHLSVSNVRRALAEGCKKPHGLLLGCSCHSAEEIHMAKVIEADYITVGSIASTRSYSDGEVLGITEFSRLSVMANVPVYAVGGMSEDNIEQIRRAGGQGVAMISAAWG